MCAPRATILIREIPFHVFTSFLLFFIYFFSCRCLFSTLFALTLKLDANGVCVRSKNYALLSLSHCTSVSTRTTDSTHTETITQQLSPFNLKSERKIMRTKKHEPKEAEAKAPTTTRFVTRSSKWSSVCNIRDN